MGKSESVKPKKRGVANQQGTYAKIAAKQEEILSTLFKQLKSENESVALGAAKTLLNKILPDLKAVEVTGQDNGPIQIHIVEDVLNNNNE